ncbi:PsiF family protein [Herbaspirillum sp. RV1423]|uniref:PsiF family protein n=1 Tax=Herbaspirillum sp. RV1423 TaxID=1443993 RepID=UPI0004AF1BA4|nr:PsiF family protein [Herbaspirillum sp. RV1423]
MKKLLAAIALIAPVLLSPAAMAQNTQQSKMTSCNKDATGKKGDERKAFMKECLSNKPAMPAAPATQQEKMKTCNADAKGKKGDERKAFMKECLKKDK